MVKISLNTFTRSQEKGSWLEGHTVRLTDRLITKGYRLNYYSSRNTTMTNTRSVAAKIGMIVPKLGWHVAELYYLGSSYDVTELNFSYETPSSKWVYLLFTTSTRRKIYVKRCTISPRFAELPLTQLHNKIAQAILNNILQTLVSKNAVEVIQ